jgi:hypothetical protein
MLKHAIEFWMLTGFLSEDTLEVLASSFTKDDGSYVGWSLLPQGWRKLCWLEPFTPRLTEVMLVGAFYPKVDGSYVGWSLLPQGSFEASASLIKHEREDWHPPFQYLNYYYL